MLEGEVYNGGMDQYFWNFSGSVYGDALNGLEVLGAQRSRELLLRAKQLFFGNDQPPTRTKLRREAMNALANKAAHSQQCKDELEAIDIEFCSDPDQLSDRLLAFAEEKGLVTPFELEKT